MTCKKDHRFNPIFKILNHSQGGDGRHFCCGCAYEQGFLDGFNRVPENFRPYELPESQAGEIRHKSAEESYVLGYQTGLRASGGKVTK